LIYPYCLIAYCLSCDHRELYRAVLKSLRTSIWKIRSWAAHAWFSLWNGVRLLIFYVCFRYGGLIVTIVVGGPVLLFGLALAFLKIQDQPFSHFAFGAVSIHFAAKVPRVEKRSVRRKKLPSPPKLAPISPRRRRSGGRSSTPARDETRQSAEELANLFRHSRRQSRWRSGWSNGGRNFKIYFCQSAKTSRDKTGLICWIMNYELGIMEYSWNPTNYSIPSWIMN